MILALCSVAGIAYQTCAQFFGLPGELPLPAFAVTVIWAGFAAGLLGWVTLWAASVRHRRLTHRFPVQLTGTTRSEARSSSPRPRAGSPI